MHTTVSSENPGPGAQWFEHTDESGEAGLRFACTMCGNCCTGPEGYVLVSDSEVVSLARRFGMQVEDFLARYTRATEHGRSLIERTTAHGRDCVFLDREKVPGKAVCGVYEDRPVQCRTWPFWKSNLTSRYAWQRAKRVCPGMDNGPLFTPLEISVSRDRIDI